MGEKQGNCIYVDADGKWWLAEVEDVLGEGEIILVEEKTEELKELFTERFIDFINKIAPHILFIEEGQENFSGTDAKNRKVVHQN